MVENPKIQINSSIFWRNSLFERNIARLNLGCFENKILS